GRARQRRDPARGRRHRPAGPRRPGRRFLHLRRIRAHARAQRIPQPDAGRVGGDMSDSSTWLTQQLVEFLAAVSSSPDERIAIRTALERAAEAFEAEVGAVELGGEVVASVGLPARPNADAVLRSALLEGAAEILIDGVG